MSNNNQQASREPTAATAAATQTQTQENLDEEVIPLRLTPAPRISWQEVSDQSRFSAACAQKNLNLNVG